MHRLQSLFQCWLWLVLLLLHGTAHYSHAWVVVERTLSLQPPPSGWRMSSWPTELMNRRALQRLWPCQMSLVEETEEDEEDLRASSSSSVANKDDDKSIENQEAPTTMDETMGEDECYDLCDIDWDLMPGFEEDGGNTDTSSPSSNADQKTNARSPSNSDDSADYENSYDEDGDDEESDDGVIATELQQRQRLELQWQLWQNKEDCDVTESVSTCGKYCVDCDGRGWQLCRFCHGKARVWMGSRMTQCLVCTRNRVKDPSLVGTEICRSCRGSGWVAPWTNLANHVGKP